MSFSPIATLLVKTVTFYLTKFCKENETYVVASPPPAAADVEKKESGVDPSSAAAAAEESEDLVYPFDAALDVSPNLRPSSSIEAVNLNSWPTSAESTPDQMVDKLANSLPSSAWTNRKV